MSRFILRNKDSLATFFGGIAGICGVLVSNEIGDPAITGTFGGIATVFLGLLANYDERSFIK